jgi:hypothetical protein
MASSIPLSTGPLPDALPVELDIALGEIHSPRIHAFDAYWRRKCAGDRLPSRADIDPVEIKPLLPYFLLTDLEMTPFRVRFRLSGTLVDEHNGPLTNSYVDQLQSVPPHMRAKYVAIYETAYRERRPVFVRDYLVNRFGAQIMIYGGVWPLAGDGTLIDKCAAMEDYPNRADLPYVDQR